MGVAVEHLVREEESAARSGRIALIGLRGAGKSTLGQKLAHGLGLPFVEPTAKSRRSRRQARRGVRDVRPGRLPALRSARALQRVLNQNERAVHRRGRQPGHRSGYLQAACSIAACACG